MTTFATLLPHEWFALHPALLAVIAVVAMVIVIRGADWLVEGAAGLAMRFGMPEVIVGATIVSLGTTAPETAVSVLAAFSGNAGLALGNGVGSIIADTGLIFGLGCVMTRLPADKFVLSRQGWVQAGSGVMLAAICYGLFMHYGTDAVLPRIVGVCFLVLLVGYLAISVKWAKQHPTGEPHLVADGETVHTDRHKSKDAENPKSTLALCGIGLGGLLLVIFAGDALVNSVTGVAEYAGIPDAVIAGTIVALGTSLPELVTGITAIRKGHPELLVGNVIGADILNVLFVIGMAAVAAPLPIVQEVDGRHSWSFLVVQLPTMLAMLVLFRLYIVKASRQGHFDKWMGWPLLAMYVAFLVLNYVVR